MKSFIILLIVLAFAIQLNNHPENVGIAMGKIGEAGISLFEAVGKLIEH